ncbi:MAG: hypothetical protein EOM90_07410 [Alphaproteobacteria bacterium]|nr:hypothetical protein [Alphaproteobacteria bacterium]
MEAEENNLKEYRNELLKLLDKSQDSFEKQLTYVSAGSIAISMAFLERITGQINQTTCKSLIILGWICLTVTLLINLLSHIFAYKSHYKTIEDIDNGNYDQKIAIKRNRKIYKLNNTSILMLILGIVSIVAYVSLNIW